ncbi:FG-GAP-like repeat-containing protein [Agromyces sp. NPDC057865]|uniref:FG-GAP-like repeat-containing protein n=1 Tax=Agromyces sp. NPDC057865 TaxID=3346267 RepID=UPI00366A6984
MSRPRTRSLFSITAAALLLAGLATPTPAAAATDADDQVYNSIIVTDATGAPLEEAYIRLQPVQIGGQVVGAATGPDGVATFSNAPAEPTAYWVSIRWDGVGQGGTWRRIPEGFSMYGSDLMTMVSSADGGERLDGQVPIVRGTGTISGTVLTALGTPVAGARVEVRRVGGVGDDGGGGFGTSEDEGGYAVLEVPPGTFEVWATCACGAADAPFGTTSSPRVVVTIEEGQALTGIDVRLGAKGRLSGVLLTEAEDGTQTTLVDPTRAVVVYPSGKPPTRGYAGYVVLFAPDGAWRRDVEPGEYQVVFGRYLTPVGGTQKVFVPDQYYDGMASPTQAKVVVVEPAIETTGIDAVYPDAPPPPVGPVQRSIYVRDQDGTAVPGAVTVVTSIASGESFRSSTDQGGFSSFPAAPYLPTLAELRVEFREDTWVYTAAGFVHDAPEVEPTPVWIQAGGGQGIIGDRLPFRLASGSISGTVSAEWSGSTSVRATLTTATGDVVATTWPNAFAEFTFSFVSDGSYRLSFDRPLPDPVLAPFGVDVRWYRDATQLADATPIVVDGGAKVRLAHQVLAQRGRISGAVVETSPDGTSVPLTDRTVAVYPEAATPTSSGARFATVQADGSWSIDLYPGRYRVAFGRSTVAGDPATFIAEQYFDGGTSPSTASTVVVVAAQESRDIDAKFARQASVSTPTVSGSAVVGSTLTVAATSDTPGVSLAYEWLADGSPLAGASGPSLELRAGHLGKVFTARVTASAPGYATVSKDSGPTGAVAAGTLTTARPTISGSAVTGSTLSASPGTWISGTSYAYQWFAGGVAVGGATGSTLKLTAAHAGTSITVQVTGTKPGYATAATTSTPTAKVAFPAFDRDFSGDDTVDVLARTSTGAMLMYTGDGASGWKGASTIGSGWTAMNHVFAAGDFSGDGHEDVMARDTAGRLHLYRGDGKGGWLGWGVVGTGWGHLTAIFSPGDFSGDGKVDVMARDGAGDLWLYPGDGKGGWGAVSKVGSGWNMFDQVFAVGDFGGSAGANVMGRTAAGDLWVYPATGSGGWATPARVGTGWNIFDAVLGSGDFDGDGFDDVMGRDRTGRLWLYPGRGSNAWGTPAVIGTGWGHLAFVS